MLLSQLKVRGEFKYTKTSLKRESYAIKGTPSFLKATKGNRGSTSTYEKPTLYII